MDFVMRVYGPFVITRDVAMMEGSKKILGLPSSDTVE
jgi:hypothetical protein